MTMTHVKRGNELYLMPLSAGSDAFLAYLQEPIDVDGILGQVEANFGLSWVYYACVLGDLETLRAGVPQWSKYYTHERVVASHLAALKPGVENYDAIKRLLTA